MNNKVPTDEEIKNIHELVLDSPLLRLMTFSDLIHRYTHLKLGGRFNWLRNYALIWIVANEGVMTPTQMAKILLRSNHDITRLIDSLEKDSLVVREHSTKDRREINVKITKVGLNTMKKIIDEKKDIEENLMSCLDRTEVESLKGIVRKLRYALVESTV